MTETLDRWKARAEAAKRNREAMPIVTAFVDALRAIFSDQVRVTYAAEAGIEIGKRGPEGAQATQPDLVTVRREDGFDS